MTLARDWLVALALVPVPACTCGDGAATSNPTTGPPEGEARELNVGNPARGLDAQPDYDAQAKVLRAEVAPRLPDPLPDGKAACKQMFAAVADHYAKTERDAKPQLSVLRAIEADDLAACTAETSPAAATCVAILAREHAGEYPWLLDQCSRAFPRS